MSTVEAITKFVNAAYSQRARSEVDKDCETEIHDWSFHSFFILDSTTVASRAGYTAEQLSILPECANLGLSCGCPILSSGLQQVCNGILLILLNLWERCT